MKIQEKKPILNNIKIIKIKIFIYYFKYFKFRSQRMLTRVLVWQQERPVRVSFFFSPGAFSGHFKGLE